MTDTILHLCYRGPHLPGSYNRTLGEFVRSAYASDHVMLSAGPGYESVPELATRFQFTEPSSDARWAMATRRILASGKVNRYSLHQDPARAAYARSVERYICSSKPTVVVVYDDVKLALRLGINNRPYKLVLSQHGTRYELPDDVRRALYSTGTLDGLIVLSDAARNLVVSLPTADGLRVDVLPNAVDTSRFSPPSAEQRDAGRRALGLGPGPVVGYVGRLTPQKGVDDAVKAFARIRSNLTDAQILIVGPGNADYIRQLKGQASSLGVEDGVVFAGPVDGELTPQVYHAIDVLMFPTLVPEGMPLVVLEAMASSVPVGAYSFPSRRDIGGVEDGLYECRSGDSEALARLSASLLSDAASRSVAGSRARARMLEGFSIEQRYRTWAALLQGYLTGDRFNSPVVSREIPGSWRE